MKNRLTIFLGLTILGAGIWYLIKNNKAFLPKNQLDPTNPNYRDENGPSHLRHVLHKAKVNTSIPDHDGALIH